MSKSGKHFGKHSLIQTTQPTDIPSENGKTMGKQSHFDTGFHSVSLTIAKILNS